MLELRRGGKVIERLRWRGGGIGWNIKAGDELRWMGAGYFITTPNEVIPGSHLSSEWITAKSDVFLESGVLSRNPSW